MARLKNVSGTDLLLYARPGQAEGFEVAAGAIVTVPGEVDEEATERVGDALIIGDRAWPTALWQATKTGDDDTGGAAATPARGGRSAARNDDTGKE